jgi:hypothetical protein
MARLARGEMIDPTEVRTCHTINRCVRRAFLCSDDPVSGEPYEHRRQWTLANIALRVPCVAGLDWQSASRRQTW